MDLKCKRTNCEFNKQYSCTKKEILIEDTLHCADFKKAKHLSNEQKQNITRTMFDTPPNLHPYRHARSIKINCQACCVFNYNGMCQANGITVDRLGKSACCFTRLKP